MFRFIHHFRAASRGSCGPVAADCCDPVAGAEACCDTGAGRGTVRDWMLDRVLRRLDASKEQRDAIHAVVDDVEKATAPVRDAARRAREAHVAALRDPVWDATRTGAAFDELDAAVKKLRATAEAGAARVHAALDERQRGKVADWLGRGPYGTGCC